MTLGADFASDIVHALDSPNEQRLVREFRFGSTYRNELLFFFKPECFLVDSLESTKKIVEMALRKIQDFRAELSGALILEGSYLERHHVMDRHYGYINRLSREASRILSTDERTAIQQAVDSPAIGTELLIEGGHEYLAHNPDIDEERLNQLWGTKKSLKLRSGLYVQRFSVAGQDIVLVNGFHPSQLQHFTAPGRAICLLLLHSDTDWKILRDELVGNTFPEKAASTSIRGELFRHATSYGMSDVSISNNGVHLSAGPFEAAFEIGNFLGSSNVAFYDAEKCNLWKAFALNNLSNADFERSLTNPTAGIDGRSVDLFTYTEDMDTDAAVAAFTRLF